MNERSSLARKVVSAVGLILWGLGLYGVLRLAPAPARVDGAASEVS